MISRETKIIIYCLPQVSDKQQQIIDDYLPLTNINIMTKIVVSLAVIKYEMGFSIRIQNSWDKNHTGYT